MTVLTTCIWIGFKVSYAPLKVPGLLALRVLLLCIHSLLFTWSLPTTVLLYLSCSLWSLTLASLSRSPLLLKLSDIQLQGCCFAELQNSCVQSPWW